MTGSLISRIGQSHVPYVFVAKYHGELHSDCIAWHIPRHGVVNIRAVVNANNFAYQRTTSKRQNSRTQPERGGGEGPDPLSDSIVRLGRNLYNVRDFIGSLH